MATQTRDDGSNGEESAGWNLYDRPGEVALQQGDLVRFDKYEHGRGYGIVVTADCDLDRRKHSRLVTLVPVVSLRHVVTDCLAIDWVDKFLPQIAEYCRSELGIAAAVTDISFLGLVKSGLRERTVVAEELGLAARALMHEVDSISIEAFGRFLTALKVRPDSAIKRFQSQLGSRGDLMMLPQPPLDSKAPRIAWLRPLWQEPIGNIALKNSEMPEKAGIRIARLGSPFRYRLTQQFAQVFADIGLPDVERATIDAALNGILV